MHCPRDGSTLIIERVHGIEVDRCPTCSGQWLDYNELAELEATRVPDEKDRHGAVQYAHRDSELLCPVCAARMFVFSYRSQGLELDACAEEHGFWLDAGEADRLRDIIAFKKALDIFEDVRELKRGASLE